LLTRRNADSPALRARHAHGLEAIRDCVAALKNSPAIF
jgi:hypothetical protein